MAKPTSVPSTLTFDDDEEVGGFTLDHIKFKPDPTFTERKKCAWCGDTNNWGWCGVVFSSTDSDNVERKVKKIGKVLLCVQCLIDGGWLSREVLSR